MDPMIVKSKKGRLPSLDHLHTKIHAHTYSDPEQRDSINMLGLTSGYLKTTTFRYRLDFNVTAICPEHKGTLIWNFFLECSQPFEDMVISCFVPEPFLAVQEKTEIARIGSNHF